MVVHLHTKTYDSFEPESINKILKLRVPMRSLKGLALALAEGALTGAVKKAALEEFEGGQRAEPPSPPPSPPSPMIAPVDERQPDAFVFLGLCLSIAIPAGMILRNFEDAAEDGSWADAFTSYERMPVWLLASYAFAAAAFGELFVHGATASALQSTHYALASCAMLCALRHSHRASNIPRRASGAVIISFVIAFSVVLFFRTSLHTQRCRSTMFILTLFCAAPCWRVYSSKRYSVGNDQAAERAKRRGKVLCAILVAELALQPWLGVCMSPVSWAEGVQMGGELAVLALATESLWA